MMSRNTENFDNDTEKKEANILPTVAIVGRPNVGKSALFNAVVGKRISIVHEQSGVTRDFVISPKRYKDKYFQIIDTGGLGSGDFKAGKNSSFFESKISEQVNVAVESADLLLFVTDVTAGVTPLDIEVAKTLRKCGKDIIIVVNKADNPNLDNDIDVFYKLGVNEVLAVSCLHRRGIENLLDVFTEKLWSVNEYQEDKKLSVSVAGRPNVGKSSIINKLIGQERLIVSDIAGTTRDAIDMPFDIKNQDETIPATFIDTAGLRRQGKTNTVVDMFSTMRAKEAIERSNITLLIIEASEDGPTAMDAHIGQIISDCGKGCIIVANKWDECSGLKQKEVKAEIRHKLPFLNYAPIVFTCALSGYNFKELLNEIGEVNKQYKVTIPTSTVNKVVSDALLANSPPFLKNRTLKIYYSTMVANDPPLFTLFVNDVKLCTRNYHAYLKNKIRKSFNFHGLPIHLKLKGKSQKSKNMHKKKK